MATKKPKGYYGTRKHGRLDKYARYRASGRREANKKRKAAKKARQYARRARARALRRRGSSTPRPTSG